MAGGSGGVMSKPFVIALLGAESTGKSTLTVQLTEALEHRGYTVHAVSEYLREWCDANGRVPLHNEQAAIANAQSQRIEAAMLTATVVIADTSALMTAVYSDFIFNDRSLYRAALAAHKNYDLTLLMGLDVPWVADGWQRDGPQVRETVDSLIRQALQRGGISAPTIYGGETARKETALTMVLQAIQPVPKQTLRTVWKHYCECCGDGECERLIAASS